MKRTVVLFLLSGIFSGCVNVRYVAVPEVGDVGQDISTQYRYRIAGYKVGAESVAYDGIKTSFEKNYPNVFADEGIAVVITESPLNNEEIRYVWTTVIALCSAFTLPIINEKERDVDISVSVENYEGAVAGYGLHLEEGSSCTLFSPLGAFFWHGAPDVGSNRGFYDSFFNESPDADNRVEINRKAIGYGAAAKLKELEMSGRIDPSKRKSATERPVRPSVKEDSANRSVPSSPAQASPVASGPEKISGETETPAAAPRRVHMFEVENISL